MRVAPLVLTGVLLLAPVAGTAQSSRMPSAPETFNASGQTKAAGTAGAANFKIHVQAYSSDKDRTAVEEALKSGGYPAFLTALRKAPEVGYVEVGGQKFLIRWARQTGDGKVRTITLVTDKPVFFVGGGAPDAKPRDGYDVAVIQLQMDSVGLGSGTMAAAARVKPGGETGVQIDDYADVPVKLTSVTRVIQ